MTEYCCILLNSNLERYFISSSVIVSSTKNEQLQNVRYCCLSLLIVCLYSRGKSVPVHEEICNRSTLAKLPFVYPDSF